MQIIARGLGHASPNQLATGLLTRGFGDVISGVVIQLAQDVDNRIVDIIFAVAPNPTDAQNPAKYSISPTLTVVSIERKSAFWYRMTTSRQTTGQSYVITATGISPA